MKKITSVFVLLYIIIGMHSVYAQSTVDPYRWQQEATGLKAADVTFPKKLGTVITRKTVSGLGPLISVDSEPFIFLRGGITEDNYNYVTGNTGIDLGVINIPGESSFSLTAENTDWSHNVLTFTNGPSDLTIISSRLTPALLLQQNTVTKLTLFSGDVYGDYYDKTLKSRLPSPNYLKYIAYPSQGTIHLSTIQNTPITTIDQHWMLVWYGTNSHFYDTKRPLSYKGVPNTQVYQADTPLLLHFENIPTSIQQGSNGGIEFTFTNSAGYITLLPLFGRNTLKAADTESWGSQGVQGTITAELQNALDKVAWWNERLCEYPLSVSESYPSPGNIDSVTIQEDITFSNVMSSKSNPNTFR